MDNDQTNFQSTGPATPVVAEPEAQSPFVPPASASIISPVIPEAVSQSPFMPTPVQPAQQTPLSQPSQAYTVASEPTTFAAFEVASPVVAPAESFQPLTPSIIQPQEMSQVHVEQSPFVPATEPRAVPSEPFIQPPTVEVVAQEPILAKPAAEVTPKISNNNNLPLVKKIGKVVIGLVVVLLVLMFIFMVVIPKFFGNQNAKVTLTYWGLWEDSKTMQSLIDGFERQNPNILIQYSQQDIKQYRERLLSRVSDGSGPDIFRFHNSWYPMYAGVLLPLPTDIISPSDFKKTFYPVAQKDLIKNGGIYGIPLEIDALVLYTNSQLFQTAGLQPPTNWNDFISDARAITVKDANGKIKTAGASLGTYSNITHAPDIISLLFFQNGVDLLKTQDSSDRAVNALTFYTAFATDQNNVWDDTLDPSILAFSKGNLAMYFGYSWDYFAIKQNNPNLKFQIVPVPQLPNQNVNFASYWAEGVSIKTKHQKEALLFMKYLATKSTEEELYAEQAKTRVFGEPYARVDLGSTLQTNPSLSAVVKEAPTAYSSPFVDSTFDNGLNQGLNTYLGNAVNGVISGTSAQSTLETFSQGVSQVLQKYGQ
jgi:multiple sugar transport system substrate-binding protein